MEQTTTDTAAAKRLFALLVGIPIAVILLSSALYFLADRNVVDLGTVNRGELVTPAREFSSLELQAQDGANPALFGHADATWRYAVIAPRRCAESCERMLYLTRQTHVALGKKSPRVSRLLVLGENAPMPATELLSNYPDLAVVRTDAAAMKTLLGDAALGGAHGFYVIDPMGWLMMRYTVADLEQATLNQLGKDVLKDMRRLLR